MVRIPRPPLLDLLIAGGLAVAAAAELAGSSANSPLGWAVVVGGLATVPLAWRRHAPLAVSLLVSGSLALSPLVGLHWTKGLVAMLCWLVALYSLGNGAPPRRMALGGALALSAAISLLITQPGVVASDVATVVVFGIGAALAGRAVRVLDFETDVLQARAGQLERERDDRAREAVAEERARMARELHDVIGHSISVMGVQAGAVRRVLHPDQQAEREALLAVERVGRQAIAEMRRLIGLLREPDPGFGATPQPSLRQATDLIDEMRRAGLDVELEVEGSLSDLPAGPDLAAFRLLQEGLTNAMKHAPASHVRARVTRLTAGVSIEVEDDGPGATSNGTGGHGLVGMRERVSLYGGSLDAGVAADGGWVVKAWLPIEGA
jgi:signal transduction histidine kinase